MLRGCFLLLVLGLFAAQVAGQVNLVPNGSFEEFTICPDDFNQGNLSDAIGWYDPIVSTAEFLHACAYPGLFGIPTSDGVNAFDGSGMMAMRLGVINQGSREYAGIRLDSILDQGELYELSMGIHWAIPSWAAVGSIGAYFSADSSTDYSLQFELYDLPAQLQRDPDSIMSDFSIWYEWKDTLLAEGGEEFMIIGNFLDESHFPSYPPGSTNGAVYFIDDVKLFKVQEPDGIQEFTIDASIGPNPAINQLTITSNHPKLDFSILSIAGQVLQTEQLIGSGNHQLDLKGLSSGVYFVRMQTSDGERVEKLVIN